jgi:hypothetical protein
VGGGGGVAELNVAELQKWREIIRPRAKYCISCD